MYSYRKGSVYLRKLCVIADYLSKRALAACFAGWIWLLLLSSVQSFVSPHCVYVVTIFIVHFMVLFSVHLFGKSVKMLYICKVSGGGLRVQRHEEIQEQVNWFTDDVCLFTVDEPIFVDGVQLFVGT